MKFCQDKFFFSFSQITRNVAVWDTLPIIPEMDALEILNDW